MALYPEIDSPCPYRDDLSAIMDGDTCRLCKREVFDLTFMSDDQRVAFMKGCAGEVCVRYSMPLRSTLAATALAAAAFVLPTAAAACEDQVMTIEVMAGGIKDPANVQYVKDASDKNVPAVPVVYEPKPEAPAPQQAVNSKAPS
jgi:predicted Fe-S protein YdhL (DUF1289 family)